MVTAGVYLLILMSPLIETSDFARQIIIIVGALTCIFAASVAVFQDDIKRIIAYSTCSQLGYMFMSIGASAYIVAYFHLLAHAFFKALLFLGAGSVIHSMSDEQDIKKMGGLYNKIPVTYLTMIIGSLALVGLPFFSGYYSKDLILEMIFLEEVVVKDFIFLVGIIGVFLTTVYSSRLIIYVFHRENLSDEKVFSHIHESPVIMIVPLVILAVFSAFFGMYFQDLFFGEKSISLWSSLVFIDQDLNSINALKSIPIYIKKLPLFMILLGLILSFLLYFLLTKLSRFFRKNLSIIYNFFSNKWYIDEFYNFIFIQPILFLGKGFWKSIDIDLIDNLGPNGISNIVRKIGLVVSRLQSGYLYHYALSIIVGLTFFLSLFIYIF